MILNPSSIIQGVEQELRAVPKAYPFRVTRSEKVDSLWRVEVQPLSRQMTTLDETLEEATAWWREPQQGNADVLTVLPELDEIILRYASSPPPPKEAR